MAGISEELSERMLRKIRALAQDIAKEDSVTGLILHYQQAKELFEKISFLKILEEEQIKVHQDLDLEDKTSKENTVAEVKNEEVKPNLQKEPPTQPTKTNTQPEKIESKSVVTAPKHKIKLNPIKLKTTQQAPSVKTTISPPKATTTEERIKLDLNDQMAFSKKLFNGDMAKMNATMVTLKKSGSVQKAKEILSEMYHENAWKNADEYAQRLWQVVEDQLR